MSIHFYAGYWQFGVGVTNFEGEPYCSLLSFDSRKERDAWVAADHFDNNWHRSAVSRREALPLMRAELAIFSTVMTAGVLMACFIRPSATLSRRSSRLRPLRIGVRVSDSFSLFVYFRGVAVVPRPLFSTFSF